MNEILLIVSIVLNIIVISVLAWVINRYKSLKQRVIMLGDDQDRNNKDIAGLCSAALVVDKSLGDSRDQLKNIVAKVTDFEQHESHEPQHYQDAIQQVKNGASEEQLIQACGLSRDEAVLLIRLHGHAV